MISNFMNRHAAKDRRGAAAVEFALTAPILFMIIMAAFEFSRANMLINTSKIAAAEGARTGIVIGSTEADITEVVMRELSTVGVQHAEVRVNPPVITEDTAVISVGVAVPLDARNGYVAPQFFLGDFVMKATAVPREAKSDAQMDELLAASYEQMKEDLEDAAEDSNGSLLDRIRDWLRGLFGR